MKSSSFFFPVVLLAALLFVACGTGAVTVPSSSDTSPVSATSTASPGQTATSSAPTPTPTAPPTLEPVLKHPDMVLDLEKGDFWDFRWEYTDQSCSQTRGCSTGTEDGTFRVTLGEPSTIREVEMFAVRISGNHRADDGTLNMAPDWDYIGSDGTRLLASDGFSSVTIFDAADGEWKGGGFFSRFSNSESHATNPTSIGESLPFAEWAGVRTGPAISVVRSDSETMCEVIEGRRICPRDQAFSVAETQYFRDRIGPFGYTYRYSASFSGGGFFSSSTSEETVALVASSLRGDSPLASATPTPIPLPTSTPEIELEQVFGPYDGALVLTDIDNQIPDFETGVNLAVGVVDVTFVNPDVGGGNWSYGITFRHSGEETFHAVYVTSTGRWEHFARGGSPGSQVSPGSGSVSLNSGTGAENRLFVVFNVNEGALFVNGELVAELDLSTLNARETGDVRVIAGVLNTDVYNGSKSEFFDLTVLAR